MRNINNRKGAAIELAIVMLVVTFALSSLVMTVSLLMHQKQNVVEVQGQHTIALEQIGEQFLSNPDFSDWETVYPDYNVEITDGHILSVSYKKTGELLLTAKLEENEGVYSVTEWTEH